MLTLGYDTYCARVVFGLTRDKGFEKIVNSIVQPSENLGQASVIERKATYNVA